MTGTLVLLVTVLLLFALMEVLNALYDAQVEGQVAVHQATAESRLKRIKNESETGHANPAVTFYRYVTHFLGLVFSYVLGIGTKVGLIVHELMHAGAQALALGMPRVVLCSNGGYAEARPWFHLKAMRVPLFYGMLLLRGLSGMAPLVGGSLLLGVLLYFTSPLDVEVLNTHNAALIEAAGSPGSLPGALAHVGGAYFKLIFQAGWFTPLILLIGLLLAAGLTPSSVDFANSKYHLLAYALATAVSGLAFSALPAAGWIVLGLGVAAFVGFHKVFFADTSRRWAYLIGCFGMTSIVFALLAVIGVLGDEPVVGLQSGVAVVVQLLLLAAVFYTFFIVVMIVFNLLSMDFQVLRYMFQRVPTHLRRLFELFDTCTDCNMHFSGTCDGCNRTAAEIRAAK